MPLPSSREGKAVAKGRIIFFGVAVGLFWLSALVDESACFPWLLNQVIFSQTPNLTKDDEHSLPFSPWLLFKFLNPLSLKSVEV